jgi:hypothetical protein
MEKAIKLKIKASGDGKLCSSKCPYFYMTLNECKIFGELKEKGEAVKRSPKCLGRETE